jgi:hypothetical protein
MAFERQGQRIEPLGNPDQVNVTRHQTIADQQELMQDRIVTEQSPMVAAATTRKP